MTGPFDGRLRTYRFGGARSRDAWTCDETSLARAIRAFRVGVLFPHTYSTSPTEPEDWYDYGKVYLASEPGSVVEVRVVGPGREPDELVAEIPPEDPAAEYDPNALPAAVRAAAASVPVGAGDALVPATARAGTTAMRRRELEEEHLELRAKLDELERMRGDLNARVAELNAEVKRRLEQVWFIELFLGSKEQVVQLRGGAPATADDRVAVHQRVLCMDEEIVVDRILSREPVPEESFDYRDLADFDAWLLEPGHLESVAPEPKAIVALRVRRRPKDRSHWGRGSAFLQIAAEEADRMVYLLVRNGERLYRLWVDVKAWPRLFPRRDEWDWLGTEEEDRRGGFARRDAAKDAKRYAGGLLAIQGLVERSDLLDPLPVVDGHRPNVFGPQHEQFFRVVRDDELSVAIGDGDPLWRLTWKGYREFLRERVAPGIRMLWRQEAWSEGRTDLKARTGIGTVYNSPDVDRLYVLSDGGGEYFGWDLSFLYDPCDRVYEPDFGSHRRRKRVRFGVERYEVWPFDAMSRRVVEHVLRDRSQREDYEQWTGLFRLFLRLKRREEAAERPFVDLVLARAGLDPRSCDLERARCERLLRWWKLKTKENRSLGDDEPKALRMIGKAFERGDDFEDDPERLLFS